ncbi:FRAS1-related extracellular matrix protein 1-like [Ylistrum balloti]|uniref:FRAS1-related extracellular matrix protein 1-like n=1 Tax=Ylistrum balloti TaxID=509963 RepID=UPI002905BBF2|nr:FRAS1-related extracellular matrix protein 1-like [Ylistrum balloti]
MRDMVCSDIFKWILFFSSFISLTSGQILLSKRELSVRIGRSVYFRRDDLRFGRTESNGDCRVQVVQNDPITLRVGRLEPEIFDCDYLPNTIKYTHSGSPLLREDRIKLHVYRFTPTVTESETFYMNVEIVNTTSRVVLTRGLRSVVVPEFNGISNTIDASVIRFYHSGIQNVTCVVSFSKYLSHWPIAGQIVMGERRERVNALKRSCREFMYMHLHYEHLRGPSPDVDYLPLKVELTDPSISDETIIESYYLPIHIKGAIPNTPPRSSFMSMYMMDVDQFVLSTIIPGVIAAEDYETQNDQLIYNISRPPAEGEGFFVSLDDHTTIITSFKQEDLENHRIAYQPPDSSINTNKRVYEAEFVVFDSHFSESMPITLHMAVRSSATNAPRVSFNKGIVLLEGQSRAITTDDLQIVDRDNLSRVRLYVTGGLKYGRLEINGRRAIAITMQDIQRRSVIYYHDDSDTTKDFIAFRISDGVNTVLVNFPITIIPKDDSPPYLINNVDMDINEGDTKPFTTEMLLAHDTDSVDRNIVFIITHPPKAGEIIRRLRPGDTGTRINKFVQRDLLKGQIYYHHFGHEVFTDSFQFKVRDHEDPPNRSVIETFHININPVHENPPQLAPQATRLIHVSETDTAYITKAELEYTDVETENNELTYIITSSPFFVYNSGYEDAGKLIQTHNLTVVSKNASIPAVQTFKQADINHMKIAYMPPMDDIGPEARLVRFVYTVQDSSGNQVLGQYFEIDVQPVNNQPPAFVSSKLLVEESGILGLSVNQLSATDSDTLEADLEFILDEIPNFGVLQKDGLTLNEGGTFHMEDLKSKNVRYIHDGAEGTQDTFTLTLTDSVNRVTKVFSVEIVPLDDQAPQLRDNLRPRLIVSEGSEVVISPQVLSATDDDTNDQELVFLIVKQPKYGILRLDDRPTVKFTQQDVENRMVKYIHTGGEIGTTVLKDSMTLIVSDQRYMGTADLPYYDLNITITPVDNSRPTIITGEQVQVPEGGSFEIVPDVLTAKDPDTPPEDIQFFIVNQPQWGYLENRKPRPGSEKSNAGRRIMSFKLQDVIDETISYVQATHRGVEPVYDEFTLYATDGTLKSDEATFVIRIDPQNDEVPDLMIQDMYLNEGENMIIDQTMLDAIDMDMPKDQITLSISQEPEHGDIVILLPTDNGNIESAVADFTVDELHSGMQLKYRHDHSENFRDRFAVTVSDGRYEVKRICNITITPINDEVPEITKNAGLQIEYGDYGLISSIVLQSMDPDNSENEVYYVLATVPRKGFLQFCTDPFTPARSSECEDMSERMNFTQHDIDMNRIRYIHTNSMGNAETDSFQFMLTDGINNRQIETFEILIRNSMKTNLALLNKGLEVREGDKTVITTTCLSATDESTKVDEIVFAIIRPPTLGQIEYIDRPLVSISSFTQMDLAAQRIVYNHLTKSDITDDSFTFTVTNGLSEAKDGEFRINIEPLDRVLPSLITNNLIEVVQGGEVVLSQNLLRAQDPDTADMNVTYLLAKPPTFGLLYNRGIVITQSFTQLDIDRGHVIYESYGSHAGLDNFLFSLSDGKHSGFLVNGTLQLTPVICSVFVKPIANDAPKLLVSSHPDVLEHFGKGKYGFRLNNRNLKVVDSDTDNENLMFIMTKRPLHGQIENTATKRYIRRKFSQEDLNDNDLRYVLNSRTRATNDSFMFRVIDSRGNTLDNQVFSLKWSIISFSQTRMIVCENIGTLSIRLVRQGAVDQMAFVGIKVFDMSAKKGQDFIPSTAQQVQFNPGVARATWDVLIRDDNLLENTEKFRIALEEPVNAVLGKNNKASVRVINSENGECPQYFGMISKHNIDSNEGDGFLLPGSDVNDETETIFHNINPIDTSSPFDSTYNTDPAQTLSSSNSAARSSVTASRSSQQSSSSSDTSNRNNENETAATRRKGKKGKRRSRSKKRRRHGNIKKSKRNKHHQPQSNGQPQDPDLIFTNLPTASQKIQAPQICAKSTKGLLHFDEFAQRMYKCDGESWKSWNPDSNQDQPEPTTRCQQGWSEYDGRCYKFFENKMSWEASEHHCQGSHSSHLTSVRSRRHYKWLLKLVGKNSFWIGLNDKANAKIWRYVNGEPLGYTRWARGRPRVRRTVHRKNCVLVNTRRKWKNKLCNKSSKRFICEQFISTSSSTSSSVTSLRTNPKRHVSRGGRRNRKTRGFLNQFSN